MGVGRTYKNRPDCLFGTVCCVCGWASAGKIIYKHAIIAMPRSNGDSWSTRANLGINSAQWFPARLHKIPQTPDKRINLFVYLRFHCACENCCLQWEKAGCYYLFVSRFASDAANKLCGRSWPLASCSGDERCGWEYARHVDSTMYLLYNLVYRLLVN